MSAPTPDASLTPPHEPPYYAVIFTSRRTPVDERYGEIAQQMTERATQQPGYLGVDSVRDPVSGIGITVSYWRDEASISAWRRQSEHVLAQRMGMTKWYETYVTHVARVERSYGFPRAQPAE